MRDGNGDFAGNSHLQGDDLSDPAAEPGDHLNLSNPQSDVGVTTDVGFGLANGGFVTVSEIRQSFHQISVPEAGTTCLFVVGVGMVGLLFWKRARVTRADWELRARGR